MPIGLLAPMLAGYDKHRKGRRAEKGLDQWIKDLYAKSNDGQLPPVPESMNPMATGDVAAIEDYVRGLQQTQGSRKAAAWMSSMMDPLQETPRAMADLQLQGAQSGFQRGQQQHDAYTQALAGGVPGPLGQIPGMEGLLQAANPNTGTQAILNSLNNQLASDSKLAAPSPNQNTPASYEEWLRSGSSMAARNYSLLQPRKPEIIDLGGGAKGLWDPATNSFNQIIDAPSAGMNEGQNQAMQNWVLANETYRSNVSDILADRDETLKVLDEGIHHPGREGAYGKSAMIPAIPGSDRASFEAIREQVQGKAFLQAFETLKGGGQITEREGAAATAAMTRIVNSSQGDDAALEAWKELRDIMARGFERALSPPKPPAFFTPPAVQVPGTGTPKTAEDYLREANPNGR